MKHFARSLVVRAPLALVGLTLAHCAPQAEESALELSDQEIAAINNSCVYSNEVPGKVCAPSDGEELWSPISAEEFGLDEHATFEDKDGQRAAFAMAYPEAQPFQLEIPRRIRNEEKAAFVQDIATFRTDYATSPATRLGGSSLWSIARSIKNVETRVEQLTQRIAELDQSELPEDHTSITAREEWERALELEKRRLRDYKSSFENLSEHNRTQDARLIEVEQFVESESFSELSPVEQSAILGFVESEQLIRKINSRGMDYFIDELAEYKTQDDARRELVAELGKSLPIMQQCATAVQELLCHETGSKTAKGCAKPGLGLPTTSEVRWAPGLCGQTILDTVKLVKENLITKPFAGRLHFQDHIGSAVHLTTEQAHLGSRINLQSSFLDPLSPEEKVALIEASFAVAEEMTTLYGAQAGLVGFWELAHNRSWRRIFERVGSDNGLPGGFSWDHWKNWDLGRFAQFMVSQREDYKANTLPRFDDVVSEIIEESYIARQELFDRSIQEWFDDLDVLVQTANISQDFFEKHPEHIPVYERVAFTNKLRTGGLLAADWTASGVCIFGGVKGRAIGCPVGIATSVMLARHHARLQRVAGPLSRARFESALSTDKDYRWAKYGKWLSWAAVGLQGIETFRIAKELVEASQLGAKLTAAQSRAAANLNATYTKLLNSAVAQKVTGVMMPIRHEFRVNRVIGRLTSKLERVRKRYKLYNEIKVGVGTSTAEGLESIPAAGEALRGYLPAMRATLEGTEELSMELVEKLNRTTDTRRFWTESLDSLRWDVERTIAVLGDSSGEASALNQQIIRLYDGFANADKHLKAYVSGTGSVQRGTALSSEYIDEVIDGLEAVAAKFDELEEFMTTQMTTFDPTAAFAEEIAAAGGAVESVAAARQFEATRALINFSRGISRHGLEHIMSPRYADMVRDSIPMWREITRNRR